MQRSVGAVTVLPIRKYASTPISRFSGIAAGCVLGALGIIFCLLAAFAAYQAIVRNPGFSGAHVVALVMGPLGLLSVVTGYRLVAGRGRKSDGGLFAPWLLRLLGIVFLVGGGAAAYFTSRFGPIFGALTLGIGCFYVANRQQRTMEELRPASDDRLQGP